MVGVVKIGWLFKMDHPTARTLVLLLPALVMIMSDVYLAGVYSEADACTHALHARVYANDGEGSTPHTHEKSQDGRTNTSKRERRHTFGAEAIGSGGGVANNGVVCPGSQGSSSSSSEISTGGSGSSLVLALHAAPSEHPPPYTEPVSSSHTDAHSHAYSRGKCGPGEPATHRCARTRERTQARTHDHMQGSENGNGTYADLSTSLEVIASHWFVLSSIAQGVLFALARYVSATTQAQMETSEAAWYHAFTDMHLLGVVGLVVVVSWVIEHESRASKRGLFGLLPQQAVALLVCVHVSVRSWVLLYVCLLGLAAHYTYEAWVEDAEEPRDRPTPGGGHTPGSSHPRESSPRLTQYDCIEQQQHRAHTPRDERATHARVCACDKDRDQCMCRRIATEGGGGSGSREFHATDSEGQLVVRPSSLVGFYSGR